MTLKGITDKQDRLLDRTVSKVWGVHKMPPQVQKFNAYQIFVRAESNFEPNTLGSCFVLGGYPGALNQLRDKDGVIRVDVFNMSKGTIEEGEEFPAMWTFSVGAGGAWVASPQSLDEPDETSVTPRVFSGGILSLDEVISPGIIEYYNVLAAGESRTGVWAFVTGYKTIDLTGASPGCYVYGPVLDTLLRPTQMYYILSVDERYLIDPVT